MVTGTLLGVNELLLGPWDMEDGKPYCVEVVKVADSRLDARVWVKSYKQAEVGEHTKLPSVVQEISKIKRRTFDCRLFEKDGELWKRIA